MRVCCTVISEMQANVDAQRTGAADSRAVDDRGQGLILGNDSQLLVVGNERQLYLTCDLSTGYVIPGPFAPVLHFDG